MLVDLIFSLVKKVKGILANPVFKLETRGVDGLLKAYGIDGTFKFKTREDVDKYVAEVKKEFTTFNAKSILVWKRWWNCVYPNI